MSFFLRPVGVRSFSDASLIVPSQQTTKSHSHQSLPPWHHKIVGYTAELLGGDGDSVSIVSTEQLNHVFTLVTRLINLPVSSGKLNLYFFDVDVQ
jgi:hypothetical protein